MNRFLSWLHELEAEFPQAALRRRKKNRHASLRVQQLEPRLPLAADSLGAIEGVVFADRTGDGALTGDDTLLDGVSVELFLDDGDGSFDAGDASQGTETTDVDGRYRFDGLSAGRYFVVESVPAGFIALPGEDVVTVDVSAAVSAGIAGLTIDSFDTSHSITAVSSTNPAVHDPDVSSHMDDGAVLGGEQDLSVSIASGLGQMELHSDFIGMGVLQLSSDGNVTGSASVTWDGDDDDGDAINFTGLGGQNLTVEGGEAMEAFLLDVGAQQSGATLTLDVYTDEDNWSRFVLVGGIPDTGGSASETVLAPFDEFSQGPVATGPANFSNVGAIRMTIGSDSSANDSQAALTGTVGASVLEANFANFIPLSLGDQVWSDVDNSGTFESATESGIAGVTLNVYRDDGSQDFDPMMDEFVATVITDVNGNYLFENLIPGDYIVQIPPSEFTAGQPLEGMSSSTGNDPVPSPNDNVNNDDNGFAQAGQGAISSFITLSPGDEPTNDGDSDPDTNLTLDFGFHAEVDLEVLKSENADPVISGNQITWTITVMNNGPAAATDVQFVDTLPPEVVLSSAVSSQGSSPVEVNGDVTAQLGTIGAGDFATVTIVADVPASFSGLLTNVARADAAENESNAANNEATEETTIVPEVDLSITKSDAPDPVVPGHALVYEITVINSGPSNATGVVVTDNLPAAVDFVSASSTAGLVPTHAAGVVTANVGSLADGDSAVITVNTVVNTAAAGLLSNTASVTANETDPNPANNTTTIPTDVEPEIDLQIEKMESEDPVAAGDSLFYTITVSNDGPSIATGVVVEDTLPAEVVYVAAMSSHGAAPVEIGGVVTANVGTLTSGESAVIEIEVMVPETIMGTLTNSAMVTANENESDLANNAVTIDTMAIIETSSLSGEVFVDFNNNGIRDGADRPLAGVLISLMGTDITGAPVMRSVLTSSNGSYSFEDLLPGTYQVNQMQPGLFPDGQVTAGTSGGMESPNQIAQIDLPSGVEATGYLFAELVPTLSKRSFLASS